ncbi:MAG: hypothetical protein D6760_07815 [Deltaproteobacteria bacterium]|nr:MAG: hypothetical protein D6760_07815 [Deltaproteobacteria bacterium]
MSTGPKKKRERRGAATGAEERPARARVRVPVAPPTRRESPATRYDRRRGRREIDEGMEETR